MEKSKVMQDVLSRVPRYGGYLKIHKNLPADTQPRRQLIDSKGAGCLGKISDDWELDQETLDIVANVIGCVMQIARNQQRFSSKQIEITEKFLNYIKDNSKEDLPNINGILKCISSLEKPAKRINQIGDFTYAYKHNNDVYCALDKIRNFNTMNNFGNSRKSRKCNPNNYFPEVGMSLRKM